MSTTDGRASVEEKRAIKNGFLGSLTELLFVALPLVVLLFVFQFKGTADRLVLTPEWAFAAAVLFGQGLVKLVRAVSSRGGLHAEGVGLFSAALIVLGLVPSLVILLLMLLSEPPAAWLVWAQWLWFVASVLGFIACQMFASLVELRSAESDASISIPTPSNAPRI